MWGTGKETARRGGEEALGSSGRLRRRLTEGGGGGIGWRIEGAELGKIARWGLLVHRSHRSGLKEEKSFARIVTGVIRSHELQRSLRDIVELYGCERSLDGVEKHRKVSGLDLIGSKCFEAANLSAVFIDDGIMFDKILEWDWHKSVVPAIGRILRIEHLAETILNVIYINMVGYDTW
ncbi:uncharacterized protein A4U43_C08F15030 [Asparagus officinalis]|nr:uncharacterized protein A4U43_C08F15030 [Asparagus officinalis]